MSQMKMEFLCEKFQENVFDPSRCQNCFKSRELHVTTREDLEQVKPIYASWLCIAPEGLDFDKPVQRSRKWQRRFFVLYENGCLEFALDELLSTIPQGTINLHQCNDVIHAEERTGQKNTLCIITPDKEIYIRGDSKDIISGSVMLLSRTIQQEEASTMKSMYSIEDANTGAVEANKLCKPSREDEPRKWKTLDIKQTTFNVDTHQTKDASLFQLPLQHQMTSLHSPDPWRAVTPDWSPSNLHLNSSASHSLHWQEDDAESNDEKHSKVLSLAKHITQVQGNTAELQAKTLQDECDKNSCFIKCSMNVDKCWTDENEQTCPQCTNRSQTACIQIMEKSAGQLKSAHSNITPHRRLQTVEAKAADSTMTASQLVGEIDLTTCHGVNELHDQRNFVFEIWTHRMTYKLATVTAGLQQNWMKALTKNIQDQNAPNVARMETHSGPHRFNQFRRGRENPKTFSPICTQMFTQEGTREQERVKQNAEESINRRRGREERRQKYTIVMGSTVSLSEKRNSSTQENQQQERMREIENCWLRVEKMAIREEKSVQLYPVCPVCQDSVELKKHLEHYMTRIEELNIQSELANQDYSQDHGHSTHGSLAVG
ncbi:myosin phosphatase Rho-interacting protein isoform X3 [Silurus asotus]|uniref:Myosin phosphatase Rho-interacting protein isoform X3 n=1 Tax=Silurus asotus TaxID=30991 RepID=A0AAD5FKP5_SILAS|nr:myosin phosphatase Rho-interacting protein isoform X3 [Silurus asotus]